MAGKGILFVHLRQVALVLAIGLVVAVVAYAVTTHSEAIRAFTYDQLRDRGKAVALARTRGFMKLESQHFTLEYEAPDAGVAPMVLRTAESFYGPVTRDLGYTPTGKVTLILYPDREELSNSFGWASAQDAMGVYYTGVIRVLSPRVWTGTDDPVKMERLFRKNGPIAHELTHYVLDYRTAGNYPRWFTEGLAQYEENRLTGFVWIEPESAFDQNLYTLSDLTGRFDRLDNQALAYREAFSLVSFISERYGPSRLNAIVDDLASGTDFDHVLKQHLGLAGADLQKAWLTWVYDHPDRWNQ
ncbi:MAG: peptidase MA family metallohydrolase [Bacillota bacterium]